jgi:hypothetical protein
VWGALASTPTGTLAAAAGFFALAIALLAVALAKTEFGKAARRRRRLRQALARTERLRAAVSAQTRPTTRTLTPAEAVRLGALRPRHIVAERYGRVTTWGKLRLLWSQGYAGAMVAVLVGAFSMATHFGAYWLIAGGGWPGAIAITVLSTVLVVAACIWIGLGLLGPG